MRITPRMTPHTSLVRLSALCLLSLALPASLAVPGPAQAANARCHGRVPTIVGTRGDDRLVGTRGPDVILARAGNDVVRGSGGADVVCGGTGGDKISGGGGDDRLYGESDDCCRGGGGDLLEGGPGNDLMAPGPLDQPYPNIIAFWHARHGVTVDLRAGTATGDGHDRLVLSRDGTAPLIQVIGSIHDDVIRGSRRADWLVGGDGDDLLRGRDGPDHLFGDFVTHRRSHPLSHSDDRVYGNDGADYIAAFWGSDLVRGGGQKDIVNANGDEPNRVFGGSGADDIQQVMFRQDGVVADGGPGRDVLRLRVVLHLPGRSDRSLTAEQAAGTVTLVDDSGTSYTAEVSGFWSWELVDQQAPLVFHGDDESTHLSATGAGLDADLGSGDDSVIGTLGVDVLDGGAGDDSVRATAGVDTCTNFERGTC